ncbi:MAG: aldo/keto reductase [Acidobacteria bacterium]|nr:aldo/keto reductase [Acidobacteriota bacterium]
MEYRQLGKSGLMVPEICFGTATFGGTNEFFKQWGSTQTAEARKLIDICMEAGVNFFDTADGYSDGNSEIILAEATSHLKREEILLSTKAFYPTRPGPNGRGTSRYHLTEALHASLKRLKTDYIDIWHMHGFDALTPVEETMNMLDKFVREGKVRYIAASNYSGWHLMKSNAVADRYGWSKFVAHQVYYSLVGRDYEFELMPLAVDQGIGALVWSPLGWGRLTGKIRRGAPVPENTRYKTGKEAGPVVDEEHLFKVVDALDAVAAETGKSVPQVALAWVLARPTVSSVIIGARNEEQLRPNLDAASLKLSEAQIAALDKASQQVPAYPYWHQQANLERNPFPVPAHFEEV